MGDTVNVTEASDEIEIMIKRLHSGTYDLCVKKNVSIIVLKERIGCESGVVSGLQHLLFRGRVLKDDRFLSDYHVEGGHTLYLVVRTSIPLSASSNAASGPILSRVDRHRFRLQPSRNSIHLPAFPVAFELISQLYRDLLRRNDANNSQPSGVSMGDEQDAEIYREVLSFVRQNRRQLLIGEITECLYNISMLLVDGVNRTNPSSLRLLQGREVESEILLQNLGNSLVELGRAISRFSMGERPVAAVAIRPSQSRLQTSLGARNLPLAAAPTNVDISMHVQVGFYWPSPSHQLATDEELEDLDSEVEMVNTVSSSDIYSKSKEMVEIFFVYEKLLIGCNEGERVKLVVSKRQLERAAKEKTFILSLEKYCFLH